MQLSCTMVFFVAIHFFSRPGNAARWIRLAWIACMVIAGLGLWEYRLQHVPWAGHIPSFLKIDDPSIDAIVRGGARYSTHKYRVQSVYSTCLAFAEILALMAPFVIHVALTALDGRTRLAAVASCILMFFVTVMTDSRLGIVGFVVTGLLYLFYWGVQKWVRQPRSMIGPAIVLGYPALFMLALSATFMVGSIRQHVWGGGAQAASTEARVIQYRMGMPLILHNPFGHGIGQGALTLGFAPYGFLSIDSYFLTVALECGVLGFLVFFGLILVAMVRAFRFEWARIRRGVPATHAVPIGIALTSFFIIKSVFSQIDNLSIVYMMLGMLVALLAQPEEAGGATPVSTEAQSRPLLRPDSAIRPSTDGR
jgi:hypothetical protein